VDPDTAIGGSNSRFPVTRRSALLAARGGDAAERARAVETLLAAYWKPAYKYIRLKWRASNEDAKDLTQAFFARALDRDFFAGYDPDKSSFRSWLRLCLDGFVSNERKAAGRLKRSGGQPPLPLDFETAEGEIRSLEIADGTDLDRWFHQEWTRSLFAMTVTALRGHAEVSGKQMHYRLFEEYDLDDANTLSYADLAARHGLQATDVTNYLAWARREFRRLALETLRDLTATEREFRDEAFGLFGREP
jgi:DNA-directed RNA polymerase specialized sigma24 family protein